jgi:hypothetical protein
VGALFHFWRVVRDRADGKLVAKISRDGTDCMICASYAMGVGNVETLQASTISNGRRGGSDDVHCWIELLDPTINVLRGDSYEVIWPDLR